MENPLKASSSTAGALLAGNSFLIPQFQREYAWQDEVGEFWDDLQQAVGVTDYFLGLVILTDEGKYKQVVDGQQRLITLSLLCAALYFEAVKRDRRALADRIQATFLRSIDYDTDETKSRIRLSSSRDNSTFQSILNTGRVLRTVEGSVSDRMAKSYSLLLEKLRDDLKIDPFKRLGRWAEFLNEGLYFAIFVHPDQSSAYQVYEVINTRGRELTTADLLKSYVLSQTAHAEREARFDEWQRLAANFSDEGSNNFVQYIRHAVTVEKGHILPKDLFKFLAGRDASVSRSVPTTPELMHLLATYLPLYLQIIDPGLPGQASPVQLDVFIALNSLGVLTVRPLLLAIAETGDVLEGVRFILRLVVRRIVVGNLGTGNVERRFGEAARKVHRSGDWRVLIRDLADLNPSVEEFTERLARRSFNKATLTFLRRSVIQGTMTPTPEGQMEFIWTRQANNWAGVTEEDGSYWASTVGNTFLVDRGTQVRGGESWADFKEHVLPNGAPGELVPELRNEIQWTASEISRKGRRIAEIAADIWY